MPEAADAADVAATIEEIVEETIRFVAVRREGDTWVGDTPEWFGPVLFGGFVLGQATHAATRARPEGQRLHSLHGYFVRPMAAGEPVTYEIAPMRDGRTVSSRRVDALQRGELVFTMLCSFTRDTDDGYDYELDLARGVPGPEQLEVTRDGGPWLAANAGPTPVEADGTRRSTRRAWFRLGVDLVGALDDPDLHTALLAFLSDMTWTGGRPLDLDNDTQGMVSLDHALWLHRPARADEWLMYDVQSLVNAGGRGMIRGTMHREDHSLVASVAQEMRLRRAERA